MRPFLLLLCLLIAAGCSTAPPTHSGATARTAREQAVAKSNCSIGFRELFFLAKGREWTQEEGAAFKALDQPARNHAVKQLAAEAGCVRTEDQVGTDGVVYTAFWKQEHSSEKD